MGSTQGAIASGFAFLVLSAFVGTTSASAGAAPGAPFALAQIDVAPEAGTAPPTPPAVATDPGSGAE
jgi:hypothetical protein